MEEKKIYIVTEGSYSDYHIEAVFSTRKKAKEFMDTKDQYARIEEFPIDEPVKREVQVWDICINLDTKEVSRIWGHSNLPKDLVMLGGSMPIPDGNRKITFTIESDSKKRAIKIASERLGAVIANERTMYPFLRVKVVRHPCRDITYPAYNFNTGAIVLGDLETIENMPEWVKVEQRKSNK